MISLRTVDFRTVSEGAEGLASELRAPARLAETKTVLKTTKL